MNLKSVFFSLFFLVGSTVTMAEVVDVPRAQASARQFMHAGTRIQAVGEDTPELVYTAVDKQQQPMLYAFNFGKEIFHSACGGGRREFVRQKRFPYCQYPNDRQNIRAQARHRRRKQPGSVLRWRAK